VDVLGDEIASASLHEVLTVVRDPLDQLMTRLVELGFNPITQTSTLTFALSLFVVRYGNHFDDGVTMADALHLAQAEVLSHAVVTRFLSNQVGETIDRNVTR